MRSKTARGITIISLVITIILMLILAGVTIMEFTGHGLITQAQRAKENHKIASIEEQLKLAVPETMIDKNGDPITTDDYMNTIRENENINITNEEEEDGKIIITIDDKYVFEIGKKDSEIYIEYIGKKDKLAPKITLVNISNTTNSITVKVNTKRNEGGKIEYYIKGEEDSDYELKETKTEEEYTYTGLEQNKKYNIKIVAVAKNKETAEVLINRSTGNIEGLTPANTTFTYTPAQGTWTNGSVTVTVSTTITGYTLQTSTDGKKWDNTTSQTLTTNGPVYARLWDGTNYGGAAAGNVTNIDKTKPIVTGATTTTNSITITATDEASGIIGYEVTTNNTEPSSFTECANTKTLNVKVSGKKQGTTYYVWVKDAAGNVSASRSTATGNIEGLTPANTTFTYTPAQGTWTNGSVTVTVSTTITGYTLQTSKDGKKWDNTSSQTLTTNGPVYARLWDGTNYGGTATGNVTNIDTTKPIVTGATATTNSITITATDEASGIIGYAVTTSNTEPSSFTECTKTKTLNIKVSGKKQGTTYYVWVKDAAGNVSASRSTATGNIDGLTPANTTFTYTPAQGTWTNGSVTVTVSTTITGYTLQTSKDGKKWDNTSSQTLTTNGPVYARLWDGTNYGGTATGNVTNIDTTKPIVTGATATTNSITITATDEASGIIGYAVTTSNTEPSSFTECTKTKTLNIKVSGKKQETTYYVWVKDAAGNVSASKSATTGTVTSGTITGAIKFSTVTWSGGKASTTISTNTSYTIQYQINSTTGTWTTGTNVTGRSHGDIVYARLWDGTNGGTYTTLNILDGTAPSASIKLSSTSATTVGTITATVTQSDNQSGVKISNCKWVYNTTAGNIGTNASSYTGGTFTSTTQNLTLKTTTAGTYYLHVLTVDNVGNAKETISGAVTVEPSFASKVSVGDYVAYDPTNNYSYTSPKGTGMSHGNGFRNQKFTSSSSIKWRVLSKDTSTGEVVLISEIEILSDEGELFDIEGAIGYLYAEQELNEICAIYGHGIGANTSKTFTYEIGALREGTETGIITGSGARSINVDDINKITGYKTPPVTSFTVNGYYPTRWTEEGYITSITSETYEKNWYAYDILDDTSLGAEYEFLYKNVWSWLSSRYSDSGPSFGVRFMDGSSVDINHLFHGYERGPSLEANQAGVRPIVYLKPTIKTNGKDSNGAWTIVDQ